MGINKTSDKILQNFFWPGLRKDVSNFIKTCDICQRAGKPNEKIPPAPLKPIPVVDQPFEHVIIDCVGPLPKTRKGKKYLLTLVCASTRYPEVFPLSNIKAKTIVASLVNFFAKHGIPKVIQSNQGTNFTSTLFGRVMEELGVTQYLSTACHPESQGALERFHQTLKSMLKTFYLENEKDWDVGLDLVMFAIRDSRNESMGMSPFQLLYGREIRGPLKVLKTSWIGNQATSTLPLNSFDDFQTKLNHIHEFAQKHLSKSQTKMKENYDKNACFRTFSPGDKVLVLLLNPLNSLQAKYTGPYIVEKKVSNVNYVIKTPGRRKTTKLVHINLHKPYHLRTSESYLTNEPRVLPHLSVTENEQNSILYPNVVFPLENDTIFDNLAEFLNYLPPVQNLELAKLLKKISLYM